MTHESLGSKQRRFVRMVAELIVWAYASGYELTFGDAYRDPRLHGEVGIRKGYGSPTSCHKSRLAIDLNLFKDGVFLSSSEDHRPLGEFWKSLSPDCRWGGDFKDSSGKAKPDGNHYSVEFQGRA